MAYTIAAMVVIETHIFTKRIKELMSDDEYGTLQEALITRPAMGDLIQGTGGLRKIRWKQGGQGKRGGIRVIYYLVSERDNLYMLYVYPKSKQENLTPEQKKDLRSIVERWSNGKQTV